MNKFKLIALLLLSFTANAFAHKSWQLNSPDGKIRITISLKDTEAGKAALTYQVVSMKKGQSTVVIEPSPLGINREDQQFSENLSFVSLEPVKTINEKYKMFTGRQSNVLNHAKELALTFKNSNGALLQVDLRAYNDGIAFRYIFPEKSNEKLTVNKELTGFNLPDEGKMWAERFDTPSKWGPSYEVYYENRLPIGSPSPNVEGWAFPMLFNTKGHYLLVTEANLTENFCGMRIEQKAPNGLYKIRLPNAEDALGLGKVEPMYTLPWIMPWRTVIIGSSLATIYESQMVNSLSNPAQGDYSWVKPGRASWGWNTNHDSAKEYHSLKDLVDLAAEMNWEYSLVDANWDLMEGGNIEQLAKYSNSKNVSLLLWYNSGGPQNNVSERPRDIMNDPIKRKAEFKKLRAMGVKGVKIDFWHSDKQNLIEQYMDVLKDAAEEHMLVNFHGCTLPRGWSRTYPHLIGFEAVKGEENYDFDPTYPAEAVIQNTITPFSRNVLGPMDYTTTGLSNLKYPHLTTYAHELALNIVFNSGIIHFADAAATYRAVPDFVKEFLKEVPATFDETRFISGEPGISAVVASRKGTTWYIAGLNSEKSVKDLKMQLPFLGTGKYKLSLITDGPQGKSFKNKSSIVSGNQVINVSMLANGGFLAVLKKQ